MTGVRTKPKFWRYTNSVSWEGEKKGLIAAPDRPPVEIATPPDFGGHEGIWTPEDLFLAAVNSCIMTTFLYYCGKADFELEGYDSTVEGIVELTAEGLAFTRVMVRPQIVVASESARDQATRAIRSAEKRCLISNSVSSQIAVEPHIEARREQ